MISELGCTAGWFDSSIHEFLGELPRTFPSMRFSLMTCLDGNPDVQHVLQQSRKLQEFMPDAKVLGSGSIVPTKTLLEINREGEIFFGFDEVWFCPERPEIPKPDSEYLVGPDRIDKKTLRRIAPWMKRTSCSLGLGDGAGLNVAAKTPGLVRYLMTHSVSRPASQS